MRIFKERGRNDIIFEFTERKFENKIKSLIFNYRKNIHKFFTRKNKPTGVYINYKWGYVTKDPPIHYSRIKLPFDMKITEGNILKDILQFSEAHHGLWQKRSDIGEVNYALRAIQVNFIYT